MNMFGMNPKIFGHEQKYMNMILLTLNGVHVPDRTGVGTVARFDEKIVYHEREFPFFTHRNIPTRMAFEEFWFFLRGKTQTKELENKGVFFWKGNTSSDFLESRGLGCLPEGDMGAAYSQQFRRAGTTILANESELPYSELLYDPVEPVDQLNDLYETLKNDPFTRRAYLTLWNPLENDWGCITPCWHSHQFVVLPDSKTRRNTLHLKLVNRSLDIVFGMNFAVQQYRLYQIAMAKLLDMDVGQMSCDLSHVHIYDNQIEYASEILKRDFCFDGTSTYDIDRVTIDKNLNTLDDLLGLEWSDWKIDHPMVNKEKFKTPKPSMAV